MTGSQSVEDRRLSNVLRSLSAAAPPPGLKDWLRRTPRSLTIEYLSRLEDQKAVRVRRWRDPGGRARHDILSVDLPRRRALLARLDNVVRSGSAVPKAAHDVSSPCSSRLRAWPLPPIQACRASPIAAVWPPSPRLTISRPPPPVRSWATTRNSQQH